MKKLIAVFILLLVIKCINAQPKKFDNILYGVAYYHEYMPYERLDKDIQMMKDACISKVDGSKSSYGIRQNFNITNAAFLFYSERIIRKLLEHYPKHPAIIGYQVDNETTNYGAANPDYFRS